ncbi:unnamed protein product [Caenorhabditis nigoni]
MISGPILDINSESEVSMFGHQWKFRGFAEIVIIVSWVRVLDHWHLVDDDQSEDKGHFRKADKKQKKKPMSSGPMKAPKLL